MMFTLGGPEFYLPYGLMIANFFAEIQTLKNPTRASARITPDTICWFKVGHNFPARLFLRYKLKLPRYLLSCLDASMSRRPRLSRAIPVRFFLLVQWPEHMSWMGVEKFSQHRLRYLGRSILLSFSFFPSFSHTVGNALHKFLHPKVSYPSAMQLVNRYVAVTFDDRKFCLILFVSSMVNGPPSVAIYRWNQPAWQPRLSNEIPGYQCLASLFDRLRTSEKYDSCEFIHRWQRRKS